ncbi:hypothetical protein [Roseinatronobacter sp. S2]|uniref:hypothetical protein n=1 Tax=Roseinatronobacter sp. S2 TaxID=3035471 RepID=UPI00240FA1B9|nr:hypothetical protein [Roseinatronobacter sp. S2]WFE73577.1 hypothetical protein P8S53_10290 [Roseinatronobacter sp. S2]
MAKSSFDSCQFPTTFCVSVYVRRSGINACNLVDSSSSDNRICSAYLGHSEAFLIADTSKAVVDPFDVTCDEADTWNTEDITGGYVRDFGFSGLSILASRLAA